MVDPLVLAAVENHSDEANVIYDSAGLCLLGIPSAWTLALKLQRYTFADEDDIIYLLQEDAACTQYDEAIFIRMVEERLRMDCAALELDKFPERAAEEWRMRLRNCVRKAKFLLSTPREMLED